MDANAVYQARETQLVDLNALIQSASAPGAGESRLSSDK
jgi:hypothetical protein